MNIFMSLTFYSAYLYTDVTVIPYLKLSEFYDWKLHGTSRFSERTSYIGLQAHNFTTAIIFFCCCTPVHSTESSSSITSEFTCEVY